MNFDKNFAILEAFFQKSGSENHKKTLQLFRDRPPPSSDAHQLRYNETVEALASKPLNSIQKT